MVLSSKADFYVLALICLGAVMLVLWLINRGLLGARFAAIEENIALAEASGIPTARMQALAFVIGSSIAGFTGGLMAHYTVLSLPKPSASSCLLPISSCWWLVAAGVWAGGGVF